MKMLHFLYRIKNKPWGSFVNSQVVPGLDAEVILTLFFVVVVFLPL